MMTEQTKRAFLDLHGEQFQSDPHGTLRACRAHHWYADTPMGPAILDYEDVHAVLHNRSFRTPGADFLAMQGITGGPLVELMQSLLLSTDGAGHDRVRRLVSKAFTAPRVAAFRPRLRALARELAEPLAVGEHDFVAEFAGPFSLRALGEFVGIPTDGLAQVADWTADIGLIFGMHVADNAGRIESALASLDLYIKELLAARRAAPTDDLLSGLVAAEEAGDLLSDVELRAMIVTLMSAGHHTTEYQLGQAMVAFMADPGQWQALRADPELAPQAVEEVMRHSPAAIVAVPRIAKAEVVLRDLTLPPGAFVLPMIAAANRDPQVFSEPDRLDITVKRRPQMTFGGGMHHCLGVALARAQQQEALLALAARLRSPRPAGPTRWLPPTEAVFGPKTLPIRDADA